MQEQNQEKKEVQVFESEPVTALESINRAEIDIQISTAKRYPRDISKFRQDAMSMATLDVDIAASCFYSLPRGATPIEGPSVRLAEIVASAWGNLRFGARIIAEDNRTVTAQGVAYDLEKNVQTSIEVSRRITDKNGRKYNDDMIGVTKNAACSIALRNAIFKAVPFTYAKMIYDAARKVAVGDAVTLGKRRVDMLATFAKIGVSKEQVLVFVDKPAVDDVGLSEVEKLIGTFNAIRDGETTVDQVFPPIKAAAPAAGAAPQSPLQELTPRVKFNQAMAICFTKNKAAHRSIVSAMTKSADDFSDAELADYTAQFEKAGK